jgi:hypothetical protein
LTQSKPSIVSSPERFTLGGKLTPSLRKSSETRRSGML